MAAIACESSFLDTTSWYCTIRGTAGTMSIVCLLVGTYSTPSPPPGDKQSEYYSIFSGDIIFELC